MTSHRVRNRRCSRQAKPKDNNAVTLVIPWRIIRLEREDGHNASNIPRANHPPRAHRPLKVSRQIHHVPAQRDRHCREQAHGDEKNTRVFEMDVLVHVEEDPGAREGDTEGEEHKPERMPGPRCGEAIQD